MRLALSLALFATLTTTLLTASVATPDTAQAQDRPIRKLPIKPRPKLKKVEPRASTPNIADRLLNGQCHRHVLVSPPQEGQYKAQCTSGRHQGKVFQCSGGRIFTHSSETRYRQWRCASSQVTNRYVLGAPTGNDPNKHVRPSPAADFACGCLPNVQESCSGGECRGTQP